MRGLILKLLIFFGGAREARLALLFRRAGHAVIHYTASSAIPGALPAADAAILPTPVSRDGVRVTGGDCPLSELLSRLPPTLPVVGGRLPAALLSRRKHDCLLDESFALRNADLTAEGVLRLFYEHTETALSETDAVVLGYGRIGELLSRRLSLLARSVTVVARRAESRTRATLNGARALPFGSFLPPHSLLVNTVPPPFVPPVPEEGTLALDLAGAATADMGYIDAAALPGRFFPASSAEILYETALRFLTDME